MDNLNEYTKLVPSAKSVQFIHAVSIPTPADTSQLFQRLQDLFAIGNARGFMDHGMLQSRKAAQIYSDFRQRHYHKVIYTELSSAAADVKAPSADYKQMPADARLLIQDAVDGRCNVLGKYFVPGKYIDGLSIVDESCVFYDKSGKEIACYDKDARSTHQSELCCKALLNMQRNSPTPAQDSSRHGEVQAKSLKALKPDDEPYLQESFRSGVKHLAWAWYGLSPIQGVIQSVDFRETYTLKHWQKSLLPPLLPLYAQACAVVRARDWKQCNLSARAVAKACSISGGNRPLSTIPFNGTAIIFMNDTTDHVDSRNLPGAYGVCQPLGSYQAGEGSMTLVQLGVIVLYQSTDTLSADFHNIVHYTRPLTKGYRYCLTHFLHRDIYKKMLQSSGNVEKQERVSQRAWEAKKRNNLSRSKQARQLRRGAL